MLKKKAKKNATHVLDKFLDYARSLPKQKYISISSYTEIVKWIYTLEIISHKNAVGSKKMLAMAVWQRRGKP